MKLKGLKKGEQAKRLESGVIVKTAMGLATDVDAAGNRFAVLVCEGCVCDDDGTEHDDCRCPPLPHSIPEVELALMSDEAVEAMKAEHRARVTAVVAGLYRRAALDDLPQLDTVGTPADPHNGPVMARVVQALERRAKDAESRLAAIEEERKTPK